MLPAAGAAALVAGALADGGLAAGALAAGELADAALADGALADGALLEAALWDDVFVELQAVTTRVTTTAAASNSPQRRVCLVLGGLIACSSFCPVCASEAKRFDESKRVIEDLSMACFGTVTFPRLPALERFLDHESASEP